MDVDTALLSSCKGTEVLQALSWLVASIGGVFAACMAVVQLRESTRWKKTELARQMVKEIWENPKCAAAMKLTDWSNRWFKLDNDQVVRITREEVEEALRPHSEKPFTEKEIYVRDCFDDLLDALQTLDHYIRRKLIVRKDVQYPLEYTACELSGIRKTIDAYIKEYEFHNAAHFLEYYPHWQDRDNRGRPPCVATSDVPVGAIPTS